MNIIPIVALFGGLAAFFTLAVALRFVAGKTQGPANQTAKHIIGS